MQAITERRALIEQSKGMLMFVYGINADAAFELLRRQSQNDNVSSATRSAASGGLDGVVQGQSGTPIRARRPMHTARQRITRSPPGR